MSGQSVILTTLFLNKPPRGSLPALSVHYFAINWQLLEEEECPQKYFHDQIFMKECAGRGDRSRPRMRPKRQLLLLTELPRPVDICMYSFSICCTPSVVHYWCGFMQKVMVYYGYLRFSFGFLLRSFFFITNSYFENFGRIKSVTT